MDETTLSEFNVLSSTMNTSCSQTPRTFFKSTKITEVSEKDEDVAILTKSVTLSEEELINERKNKLFEKLNRRHNNKETNVEDDGFKFVAPINKDKENIDYDARRQERIYALEKRDIARRKAAERARIERLESEQKIDIVGTAKKFLGEDVDPVSSLGISHIDLTVTYTGSMLNSTELLSKTLVVESKEDIDKRNELALISWINQLLGVDKESCEDMQTFSEKARHKADEMLKNSLKNPDVPKSVLVNLNSSLTGLSKKSKQWMESVSKARNYLKSFGFLEKIKDMVESEPNIAVDNLRVYVNFGIQQEVIKVLLGFNPTWLRLALECIFNVDLNIVDYSTCHNMLISFITANVFSCPRIINSKKFCPTGTKASITQMGITKLQWHFITTMLQIVTIIEYLQGVDLIVPENPPMFAIHSAFNSSRDVVTWMRRTIISRKFDLTKGLTKIGLTYNYEQKFYDSYVYIVNDLKTDLCDGIILAKVFEIIFKVVDHSLLSSLRPPNGDRLRKVGNARSVLKFAKDHDLDVGNIKAEDIVQGKMPQITEILWKMIGVFVTQKDQYEVVRRISQRMEKLALRMDSPYRSVSRLLSGFDVILYVSKQFAQLEGLEAPQEIQDYSDGSFLIHVFNYFYAKYKGVNIYDFDGETSILKVINAANDELGISRDLLSLDMVARGDYRTLELFVNVFMQKCFLVMDLEESALTLQRFFKSIKMRKNSSLVNIKDYSCKWYKQRDNIKAIKDMAAVKIQARYRGYRTRKQFNLLRNSIVKIQSIVRGFLARKKVEEIRHNINSSAIVIQRAWRRFYFIKNLNNILDKRRKISNNKKRTLAAKIVQRFWKSYKLKKAQKNLKNKQCLEEDLVTRSDRNKCGNEEEKTTTELTERKIHSTSYYNNTHLKDSIEDFIPRLAMYYLDQKEKTEIRNLAAIKIQSWYRGASLRRKLGNEIYNIQHKMEQLKQEVADNIDLDVSDLNISVHNRFSRICRMLNSSKLDFYVFHRVWVSTSFKLMAINLFLVLLDV
uniref:Abnormal spindle-like microcephaly-associated protein (inferred by orthology to a human protein) n=1 Tax=Strongyloides venezuelensis TaxID=75913 RepID=A0A0K0F907_STRVS